MEGITRQRTRTGRLTAAAVASARADGAPSRPEATRILIGAVQQLSMARSIGDVQRVVRRAGRRLTGADGATFVLREGDLCHYADEDAISPLWKGQRFPLEACISGWAMTHRETVAIEDIYVDERVPHEAYRPTFVKSLAMVPIRSDAPIGAIGNYWAERHRPSEEEMELLQALADSTAVAIENVRVWGELEQRVQDRTAGIQVLLDEATQRAEDRLRSAERRRAILNTLAHEVRNPLSGGRLLTEKLRERAGDPELASELGVVEEAMAEALRIVNDQLDQARLESGIVSPRIEPTEIEPLLRALRGMSDALRSGEEVRLRLEVEGEMPVLHTDPRIVGQILRNLLGNALKFTDEGEVALRASYDPASGVASFEVSDTGIGIAPSDQERVFEEFGQVEGAQDGRRPGTGLGLPLCRTLAEAIGGSLELRSEPGRGSTFTLRIPTSAP